MKSEPWFVVVSYDVTDDRRRRQVHKTLKNFGRPVQYSAFECILEAKDLAQLQHALTRLVQNEDAEAVAYYLLCKRLCSARRLVLYLGRCIGSAKEGRKHGRPTRRKGRTNLWRRPRDG